MLNFKTFMFCGLCLVLSNLAIAETLKLDATATFVDVSRLTALEKTIADFHRKKAYVGLKPSQFPYRYLCKKEPLAKPSNCKRVLVR